ncbi:hypothetical protein HYW43_02135 [Candidatus Daviesbacteria bacterium]|nr:hypothetical protein [Candidatus Daviesbacteria bacterium]
MKLVYTKHAEEKFSEVAKHGFLITKRKIRQVIKNPKWRGSTKYNQETALDLVGEKHILRIVLDRKGGIIKVVTFHIGKRGRYESTL